MYVCVCNGVTDRDIRRAAADGCRDLSELSMRTGAGLTCGTCSSLAGEILDQARRELAFPLPLLVAA
jgi:bacterioferritin-associated ferredoxin